LGGAISKDLETEARLLGGLSYKYNQKIKNMEKNTKMDNTSDMELLVTRTLIAPRDLVWEAWTNPEHIKKWWGPFGFTNTIKKMEVKSGGVWEFIMHGPDGVDFKNKSIYKEIIKPERIVFEHQSPKFLSTIIFLEEGNKTIINWHMLFESA
jgi:hypothetical protein